MIMERQLWRARGSMSMERRLVVVVPLSTPSAPDRSRIVSSFRLRYFTVLLLQAFLLFLVLTKDVKLQVEEEMIRPEDFLLLKGERHTSLESFSNGIPGGSLDTFAPPGQAPGAHVKKWNKDVQRMVYLLIDMVYQIFDSGFHIEGSLVLEQLVVTAPYSVPKLTAARFSKRGKNTVAEDNNIKDLAAAVKAVFIEKAPGYTAAAVPKEIEQLLSLMTLGNALKWRTAIQFHTCLVSMETRGDLFAREFAYVVDILKPNDPVAYKYVISELIYPKDWAIAVGDNSFLNDCFQRHVYDPTGNFGDHDPGLEVLRFNRNVPSHPLERTKHRKMLHGMQIKAAQLNHTLYIVFDMLLASVHLALHKLGHLNNLDLQDLFWSSTTTANIQYHGPHLASR